MFEFTLLKSVFLWGAAGVAAPIIVHLVMRQRPRPVPFPALRFVEASHLASRRRHRLKHLLLLLLRCLLVLLLALVLARPVLKSRLFAGGLTTPVRAVLIFDDSYSMRYEFAGRTRLEEAKKLALEIFDSLPAGSEIAVITTSGRDEGEAVFETLELRGARERVRRIEPSDLSTGCVSAIERACRLLSRAPPTKRREIFLFTDMTAAAWRGVERLKVPAPGEVGLYVLDVGVPENRNVFLKHLSLSRQRLGENAALRLSVAVAAGQTGGRRVVELFLDREGKKDQRAAALKPGETAQVQFTLSFRSPGLHQGKVTIRENDPLGLDNTAYFTVGVTPAPRVLVVGGGTRYLVTALSPPLQRRLQRELVRCEVISPEDLPGRRLDDYAVVVLSDVARLPPAEWGRLSQYVFNGGGLALFGGPHLSPEDYNGVAARDLVPGTLLPPAAPPRGVNLAVTRYQHPLLEVFADGANGDLGAPLFIRYNRFEGLGSGARVVIPFSDGAPALIEQARGRGRVLFFASTAGDEWTDFPLFSAPYVVFLHRMVEYLSGGVRGRLNFRIDETVRLALSPEQRGAMLTGLPPGGGRIPLAPEAGGRALVFPRPERAGNYRIEVRKENRREFIGFSVNLQTGESRLERVSRDEVAAAFPPGSVVFASSREELARAFGELRAGREVFPYLALVLLVILAAEGYLANRFYRRQPRSRLEAEEGAGR